MGVNENDWIHLIASCFIHQQQKLRNDRHGFFSHVCDSCGNGEETENLLEGLMRRGKTFTSAKLFGIYKGAVLACKTSRKKYNVPWCLKLIFLYLYTLGGGFLYWVRKHSSPNIAQKSQIPWEYGYLFVSGSTYHVLGIKVHDNGIITVLIVFLFERQR